jgi:hypothetical protein
MLQPEKHPQDELPKKQRRRTAADLFALIVTTVLFFAVASGLFFLAFAVGADPLSREVLFRSIFGAALFTAGCSGEVVSRWLMRVMARGGANEVSQAEAGDSVRSP